MRPLKTTLTVLCLMICAACSTNKPATVVEYKTKVLAPPRELLADPPAPELVQVTTTRDILDNSDAYRLARDLAAEQIRKAREWVEKAAKQYESEP